MWNLITARVTQTGVMPVVYAILVHTWGNPRWNLTIALGLWQQAKERAGSKGVFHPSFLP